LFRLDHRLQGHGRREAPGRGGAIGRQARPKAPPQRASPDGRGHVGPTPASGLEMPGARGDRAGGRRGEQYGGCGPLRARGDTRPHGQGKGTRGCATAPRTVGARATWPTRVTVVIGSRATHNGSHGTRASEGAILFLTLGCALAYARHHSPWTTDRVCLQTGLSMCTWKRYVWCHARRPWRRQGRGRLRRSPKGPAGVVQHCLGVHAVDGSPSAREEERDSCAP
jgi:hypothetical protein